MKLKQLKLNRPKSAVVLNDSEKKAITGGRKLCTLYCGNDSYWWAHGVWGQCIEHGLLYCGDDFTCEDCQPGEFW